MASNDKRARLNMRLSEARSVDIERCAERDGLTKSNYIMQAVDFYEENRYMIKHGYKDHLAGMIETNKRNAEIDQWLAKLDLESTDFYLDALNFYLDAMTLTNGQPDTMSIVTLNTLMRTVSAQLNAVESKTDTLTNIAINGFSSFSRISSGASYLIDKRDNGKLPESRVEGKMKDLNG